jgi:hypothetical protein
MYTLDVQPAHYFGLGIEPHILILGRIIGLGAPSTKDDWRDNGTASGGARN